MLKISGLNDGSNKSSEILNSDVLSNHRKWNIGISALILAALVVITSATVVDADLWGHLRFGLDALENKEITQVDPYSYLSTGQRWINHEWLAEIAFALAWMAAGSTGLILLKTVVGVLTIGLVYLFLIKQNIPPIRAGSLVIIASLGIFPAIATVRPHMFTLLFTACMFIVIALADQGKYKWLWFAPLISALWVNFHGGILAGLGFLGIWAFFHTVLHRDKWLRILPPVILSFLAILINPYGLDLVTFLLRTATVPRTEIVEWQPLQPISVLGGIYLVLLVILILGLVYSRKDKSKPLMVLLAVAVLLPFVASRHLPIFSLAVLVFGGEHIADTWSRFSPSKDEHRTRPGWIPILSIILAIGLLIGSINNFREIPIPGDPNPYFPVNAVSILKQSRVEGNLAIPFNWGEYAIWHLGPGIKVSVDGRRETAYSEEIYQANLAFQYGVNEWDAILEEHDTHLVLVNISSATFNLMKTKPGWELIYHDDTSALFSIGNWNQFEKLHNIEIDINTNSDNYYFP